MDITFLNGYPDLIGKREAWVGYAAGPKSYSQTTKDAVNFPVFQGYVDAINPAYSVSGTYLVLFKPSGTGARPTWKAVWYTASGMTEVTTAVDLSGEKVQISGNSGKY